MDYLFPNLEEARLVTGLKDPEQIAEAFLQAGVGHIVLKLGARGCLCASARERFYTRAYPYAAVWIHRRRGRFRRGIYPWNTESSGAEGMCKICQCCRIHRGGTPGILQGEIHLEEILKRADEI